MLQSLKHKKLLIFRLMLSMEPNGDISAKAFVGGNWSLLRECKLAVLRACLLEGLVYIVTIGNGFDEKIVSVGCWFGNGIVQLFESEQQRALGYNTYFEKLSDETKYWLSETNLNIRSIQKRQRNLIKVTLLKKEIAKRWWCYELATHPKHQGKGYATAIVQTIFKKAKAKETLIALSTAPEENVKKYLSMGFKRRGKGGPIHSPTGDFWIHFFTKGSPA